MLRAQRFLLTEASKLAQDYSLETNPRTVAQWKGARTLKKSSKLIAIIKFMKQIRQLKKSKKGWSKI